MTKKSTLAIAITIALLPFGITHADADMDQAMVKVADVSIPLDSVTFSDGASYNTSINFETGSGSAAYHQPNEANNIIYSLSDRGVNIKCTDDIKIIGAELCKSGKIFPVPNFAPTIYKWEHQHHKGWKLIQAVQLKDRDGNPITGLPNPLTSTEQAFNNKGVAIAYDAEGLDTEAMLKLSDGTFWLGEEYGPSIVHVSASGQVISRLVPTGVDAELATANYDVYGKLPKILAKRKLNRGIESIAVSPDEQFLYFMMQSPLANPNAAAYKTSRNVRLFKVDRLSETVIGEYVYHLDLPATFIADHSVKQSDVKISEMVATDTDKLIVLERISATTKLYKIELAGANNILNSDWDQTSTSPSLEQISDLAGANITPLSKKLMLDTAVDMPGQLPNKIEGVALIDDTRIVLTNDSDFGIAGQTSKIITIKLKTNDID